MIAIVVEGSFNAPLLSEEIAVAFPALIEQRNGERAALFTLSYNDRVLRFNSRIDVDEATFQALLAAHNPNGESRNQRKERRVRQVMGSIEAKLTLAGFTAEEMTLLYRFLQEKDLR